MSLYAGKEYIASYEISIGMNPIGHKQRQEDNRTPEGTYSINDKNLYSHYYKNMGISYPNNQDRKKTILNHVHTGGDIKIQGFADANGKTNSRNTKFLYTWGCIGVTNSDMDELFYLVKLGAVIVIEP